MARAQKVSVALDTEMLARAKTAAAADGLSLSALLMKLLDAHFERQARFESMGDFIGEYAANVRVEARHMQAIRDEMAAPLAPIRRRKRRRVA